MKQWDRDGESMPFGYLICIHNFHFGCAHFNFALYADNEDDDDVDAVLYIKVQAIKSMTMLI